MITTVYVAVPRVIVYNVAPECLVLAKIKYLECCVATVCNVVYVIVVVSAPCA